MHKIIAVFCTLIFSLCLTCRAAAQDASALEAKITDAIKVNLPAWSLSKSNRVPYMEDLQYEVLHLQWKRDKSYAAVVVHIHANADSMMELFKGMTNNHALLNLNNIKFGETEKLGIGDESCTWEGQASDRTTYGLIFRKGNVVVLINASSPRIATGFGRYIARVLPEGAM